MEVKIDGKTILGIEEMHYLAMRVIFEKPTVPYVHQKMLEDSISWWSKNLVGLDKTTRWEVKRIVNALIANEYGRFDRSKEIQIREKIPWRKFYKAGLPFIGDEFVKQRKH